MRTIVKSKLVLAIDSADFIRSVYKNMREHDLIRFDDQADDLSNFAMINEEMKHRLKQATDAILREIVVTG